MTKRADDRPEEEKKASNRGTYQVRVWGIVCATEKSEKSNGRLGTAVVQ